MSDALDLSATPRCRVRGPSSRVLSHILWIGTVLGLTTTISACGSTSAPFGPIGPTVSGISPSSGQWGATVSVVITGAHFVQGSTVVAVSGSGMRVSAVEVTSATSLSASFTIEADAAIGSDDVTVTTPAGTSNALAFLVGPHGSQTFGFISFYYPTFTVPAGFSSVTITASGSGGGGGGGTTSLPGAYGGSGASTTGTFVVSPGSVLTLVTSTGAGGGGAGGGGGGGGGGVFVFTAARALLVAAGGGGGGSGGGRDSTGGIGGYPGGGSGGFPAGQAGNGAGAGGGGGVGGGIDSGGGYDGGGGGAGAGSTGGGARGGIGGGTFNGGTNKSSGIGALGGSGGSADGGVGVSGSVIIRW